jgi:hypothetical protein
MADIAIESTRTLPPGSPPAPVAGAVNDDKGNATSNTVSNAITLLTAYIPTEILTFYVSYRALLHTDDPTKYRMNDEWFGFWLFLVLSPVVAWAVYAIKLRAKDGTYPLKLLWPVTPEFRKNIGVILWNMLVGLVAYIAWAVALPDSPHIHQKLIDANWAAFLVVAAAAGIGIASGLFGPAKSD